MSSRSILLTTTICVATIAAIDTASAHGHGGGGFGGGFGGGGFHSFGGGFHSFGGASIPRSPSYTPSHRVAPTHNWGNALHNAKVTPTPAKIAAPHHKVNKSPVPPIATQAPVALGTSRRRGVECEGAVGSSRVRSP
jgi:hypothetical protein